MRQSDGARLLASRPSGAALASLFSDHSEEPIGPARSRRLPQRPSLRGFARMIARRAREALLSQVPCEDFAFDTPPAAQFVRRRTQM